MCSWYVRESLFPRAVPHHIPKVVCYWAFRQPDLTHHLYEEDAKAFAELSPDDLSGTNASSTGLGISQR